jgi:hypothetical protein
MGTVHYRTNGYKDGRGVWSIDYIAGGRPADAGKDRAMKSE